MERKQVEVKRVSEREFEIGESRFYLGEDNIGVYEEMHKRMLKRL